MGRYDSNNIDVNSGLVTGLAMRTLLKSDTIADMQLTHTYILTFILILVMLTLLLTRQMLLPGGAAVPGPVSIPFLGNLLQVGTNPIAPLLKLRKKYGDLFRINLGQHTVVVLCGIKTVRSALVKKAVDFASRPNFFTFQYFSEGKTMAFGRYGDDWSVHHMLAVKAMKMLFRDLKTSVESIITREAGLMTKSFLEKQGGAFTPLDDIFTAVGRVKYSLFYGRGEANDADYKEMIQVTKDLLQSQMSGNIINFIPWTRHILRKRHCQFLCMCNRMLTFTKRKEQEHMATFSGIEVKDVLDALIKLSIEHANEQPESDISTEQILHTVQEFIGSGLDTVNATISWAVLYLAAFPEIQKRIMEEIDDVIGSDRYPCNKDRGNMAYTEAFIMETLRFSSVVPFALPHCTTRDTNINGHKIARDTTVLINLWSVNRDPESWSNPNTFDPSRFLDKDTQTIDTVQAEKVIPFGIGKRRCLGEPLSRMEVFLFVTSLLQKCKLEKPDDCQYDLEAEFGLVLKPKPYEIKLTARNLC